MIGFPLSLYSHNNISLVWWEINFRRCSVKKGVLKNFEKSTGKHLCQSLFFNNVAGLGSGTLLKKRLWTGTHPVNFAKFLRTPFVQDTSGWLLLWTTFSETSEDQKFKKKYVMWTCFKFWPMKIIFRKL